QVIRLAGITYVSFISRCMLKFAAAKGTRRRAFCHHSNGRYEDFGTEKRSSARVGFLYAGRS
ncbi:hypothetical protein, partial [Mesorhizobium sp. M2C.T.Ca.TU.002.02.1.1]|uniref:hypothetical protein n=1 Tax=Mesorhizobium sp. M2C.T.Ca.TU.002.02.1.1 TaxID=2496788 RepID=UPI0019D238FB